MNILERIKMYKDSDEVCMVHDQQLLTYKELWLYSDRLAGYLQQTLKEDKNPLVVYGHKDPYMLVCFLACVKSGRAYCPVDVTVPMNRVEDIVEAVNGNIILATSPLDGYTGVINKKDIHTIIHNDSYTIDASFYTKENDVYYIIFTSGSTGKPKGVQITMGNVSRFVDWALTLGNLPKDRKTYINQAPFSFDLSVMDLYMSLASEGTLWTLDKSMQQDYARLFASLKQSNADIWVSTPSFVDLCMADKNFNQEMMPDLELFLFCGETLTNKTVTQLHERFPKAKVINTYGPTESTVAITEVEISKDIVETYNPLPVGREKTGTIVKIMDQGKEVEDGQKGEIVIIGDTVSCGYFKNEEKSSQAFFKTMINNQEYLGYHTGDRGYKKDGQLFYNGRMDLQIKLHGYRMELEDIEKNLLKVQHIQNIVVMPNYVDDKVKSLTAYCVYGDEIVNKLQVVKQIKEELKAFVPDYMIPKKFIFVPQMPTTNNGKVDRKRLKELVNV